MSRYRKSGKQVMAGTGIAARYGAAAVLTAAALLTAACAPGQITGPDGVRRLPPEISSSAAVSGDLYVRGQVKVFAGAVLTIRPGTRILFEPFDPDGDGVNDSRMVVEGRLVSQGEPDAPVLFTSAAAAPEAGDWLELRMDRSEGSVLRYTVVEFSRYGLHAHFSSGVVTDSVFRRNIDGTRFGNCRFSFTGNRVTGNLGKGVNLRSSRIEVTGNIIEGNRHGVFLFEEGGRSEITGNLFSDNTVSDLRFGDFYQGDTPLLQGNGRPGGAPLTVLGRDDVVLQPVPAAGGGMSYGPRVLDLQVAEIWRRELGSFIDAAPAPLDEAGGEVAVATWESGLNILDMDDGEPIAGIDLPDVTDAAPLAIGRRLVFPSWDRKVRRVDAAAGRVDGYLEWAESPADDHRQASPVLPAGGEPGRGAVLGLWNGRFGLLDTDAMAWEWTVQLDGAVRAPAAVDASGYWVGSDGGFLYRVSSRGKVHQRIRMPAAVRTTPLVLGKDSVAVVTVDGILSRIDGGSVAWRRKLPGSGTYASPVWVDKSHRVFAAGDGLGNLSAYDTGGALMWITGVGSAIHAAAGTGAAGLTALGTEDGLLYLVDRFGRVAAKIPAGGAVHGVTVVPDHRNPSAFTLVWGARDGVVRAARVVMRRSAWEVPLG